MAMVVLICQSHIADRPSRANQQRQLVQLKCNNRNGIIHGFSGVPRDAQNEAVSVRSLRKAINSSRLVRIIIRTVRIFGVSKNVVRVQKHILELYMWIELCIVYG